MKQQVTIAREAGFSFAGFVAGQGIRFFFNLVVAKLMGAEYLGVYALSLAVLQVAEVLAVSGLDLGVLRFVNMQEARSRKRSELVASALKVSLLYSLPVTFVLLIFSGFLADVLNGGNLLYLTLVCYACSVPFHVLVAVGGHAVQAYGKLRPKIIAGQILVPGGMLLLTVLISLFVGDAPALLFSLPLSAFAGFAWLWIQLRRITGISAEELLHAGADKEMLRYARPLMFVALAGMVSHWLDILMLGWYTGPETVGLYQPAARTAGLMRSVLLAFAGIAAPLFAGMHSRGEMRELEKLFKVVSRWVVMVSMPLAVLLLVMPETVLLLFGDAFVVAEPVLVILVFAVLVQSGFGLYDTVLQMAGYSRVCFVNNLAGLAVHIVLNMLLIPEFGMNGAAMALAAVYCLLAAVRVVEVRTLLGIHAFSIPLFKPLAAGVISGIVLAAASPVFEMLQAPLSLAGGALLVFAVYLLFIRVMQLEQEELDVILELFAFVKK
ncbi:MAG: flippase [Chlorobiales bacterium]|nr:flippase [Chlorobiales bacterium]